VPPGPPFPAELHNKKVCGIVWCYTGPLKQAEKVFRPIRAFKKPILDFVGPIPHPGLQGMFDPIFPPGLQWYWKADFMRDLSDKAIALHVEHGSKMPTWQSTMHLYPVNGAAAKVKSGATPWSYRDAMFSQVIVGVDPDPANREKLITWRATTSTRSIRCRPAAHINFMMDEGDDASARHAERTTRGWRPSEEIRPEELLPGESEHQAGEVAADAPPKASVGQAVPGRTDPRGGCLVAWRGRNQLQSASIFTNTSVARIVRTRCCPPVPS
jgi:hypothetical protein